MPKSHTVDQKDTSIHYIFKTLLIARCDDISTRNRGCEIIASACAHEDYEPELPSIACDIESIRTSPGSNDCEWLPSGSWRDGPGFSSFINYKNCSKDIAQQEIGAKWASYFQTDIEKTYITSNKETYIDNKNKFLADLNDNPRLWPKRSAVLEWTGKDAAPPLSPLALILGGSLIGGCILIYFCAIICTILSAVISNRRNRNDNENSRLIETTRSRSL